MNHNRAPISSKRTENTPVLVERNSGEIQVWEQTGERRRYKVQDALGKIGVHETIVAQSQEKHPNGGRWTKEIAVYKVEEEYQNHLAEVLAADRPQKSQETPEADETVERQPRLSKRHQEMLSTPRLQKLYGVSKRPSDADLPMIDYDRVFRGSEEDIADLQANDQEREQVRRAQQEYDRYHTSEARETSEMIVKRLKQYDSALDKWLTNICGQDAGEKVKAIASNETIRLAVAGYLREKLDYLIKENPHEMPERIVRNGGKRTDAKPMPVNQYNSREYAVYLALEMLSGGFEPKRSAQDQIEYDKGGRAIRGQHREAAGQLVGYW